MGREELYRTFGPKLLEAMALVILDELNILRQAASLPGRVPSEIITALENKLSTISDYDWIHSNL